MVTDKDREAAARWAKLNSRHAQAANILRGSCDTAPLVRIMKAHREVAIAERDAQLVKWLHSQKTCGCKGEHGWCNADSQLQLIAEAIESGEPFQTPQG